MDIYEESLIEMYSSEMRFRDSIFVAGFITLLLAIIGLLGYINDEVNRRSKEIAIRKVNGALGSDIYSLFIKRHFGQAVPVCLQIMHSVYRLVGNGCSNLTSKLATMWCLT